MKKRLFCQEPGIEPCDECTSCRRINQLIHPDVFVVEPDGQAIKIDQIRELKKEAAYKGVESNKQVFIVKGAEQLNVQSSNALLKFLEEPSQDTLAILITAKRDVILPTILSRVQTIKIQNEHNFEALAISKGYTNLPSLSILGEVLESLEELSEYQDEVEDWTKLVKKHSYNHQPLLCLVYRLYGLIHFTIKRDSYTASS